MKSFSQFSSLFLVLFLLLGCGSEESKKPVPAPDSTSRVEAKPALLQLLPSSQTGITFKNDLLENANQNYFLYLYYYNGGGVSIGDINNDSLPDIYFTGNMVPNKMYLNKGNMQFEDITESANLIGTGNWNTGVTMADVNNDGFLDIYICHAGKYDQAELLANELYINNGDLTFTERAADFGVNDQGYSTHASFFDYDRDGDLDLLVVNHPIEFGAKIDYKLSRRFNANEYESDKLYRNDGGKFKDVTKKAGLHKYSWGLSATVGDVNLDGYPDIYIANDFAEPDYLYINQGNGTFKDEILNQLGHISHFGMGSDIADFNNDGLPDIAELDMMAEDNLRKKTNMSGMDEDAFWFNVKVGYHHQYMQNTLQLNQGNGNFAEVAEIAGISATDWSWAPLFVDLDNDGNKDLLITNGYRRDARDNDAMKQVNGMGDAAMGQQFDQAISLFPVNKLNNYLYRNTGSLAFEDVSANWGFSTPSFSNGAATADLDLDGDLDVVINNLLDQAFVYANQSNELNENHWLRLQFEGPEKNPFGYGVRVSLSTSNGKQYSELQVGRGYQSSLEPLIHFGLGSASQVSELTVQWPDGKKQTLQGVKADQLLKLSYADASKGRFAGFPKAKAPIFHPSVPDLFVHKEQPFDDMGREVLIPHKQSQNGPVLASGDVNGDGKEDFFIGGASGQAGQIFINSGRRLVRAFTFEEGKAAEDVGACFFDAEGDGDLDLYVCSGSNEYNAGDPDLQDRLYLNEGSGKFTLAQEALPKLFEHSSVVVAEDIDGDGDKDLFVGGRNIPGEYPAAARSVLLRNDEGTFSDVTEEWGPGLSRVGMVTCADFWDWSGDGKPDLILSGEWMPLSFFRNDGGKLVDATAEMGMSETTGWWFSMARADFDKDGDEDLVFGNLGLNSKYQASPGEPFHVYLDDFDSNGSKDIVLGYYNRGQCFPVRGRTCSSQQMPFIKDKYPSYQGFASATLSDIYGDKLNQALHLQAKTFASAYVENVGNGSFAAPVSLPEMAQLGPVQGIIAQDMDGDSNPDLLLAGGLYPAEVETARHDGNHGCFLKGDGQGGFTTVPAYESGFEAKADVRDLKLLAFDAKFAVLVAVNNGAMMLYELHQKPL